MLCACTFIRDAWGKTPASATARLSTPITRSLSSTTDPIAVDPDQCHMPLPCVLMKPSNFSRSSRSVGSVGKMANRSAFFSCRIRSHSSDVTNSHLKSSMKPSGSEGGVDASATCSRSHSATSDLSPLHSGSECSPSPSPSPSLHAFLLRSMTSCFLFCSSAHSRASSRKVRLGSSLLSLLLPVFSSVSAARKDGREASRSVCWKSGSPGKGMGRARVARMSRSTSLLKMYTTQDWGPRRSNRSSNRPLPSTRKSVSSPTTSLFRSSPFSSVK
mmetsp:Transcript_38326/g.96005  ORF Transcript_38326/g.96005 Transcript_38326/m.96005 type:complete len:273 (-) Transcript_38326:1560-2378(-)